jgi:hypothetical protein
MKVKCDFVTNSSSTSFVVWGIYKDWDDEFLKKIWLNSDKNNMSFEEFIELKQWELARIISGVAYNKYKLEAGTHEDGNSTMIGRSPFKMNGSQTLDEFKEDICNALYNFLGKQISPRSLQQIETEIPQ